MLLLAASNVVSVVLFATLYLLAGTGYLSQPGFLACLPIVFALSTALWVRTESRHRTLEPIRRFGRVVGGLVLVVIATPVVVLMPLFWLDTQLPREAGFQPLLAPVMALVLIALLLTLVVNVAGGVVVLVRAAVRGRRPAATPDADIH